jgi:hypothetical protein
VHQKISGANLPRGCLAAANPAITADRRGAAYNGAGVIDLALEHTPPSSSREGTVRPSARGGGGLYANIPTHGRQGDDRCTCPRAVLMEETDTIFIA